MGRKGLYKVVVKPIKWRTKSIAGAMRTEECIRTRLLQMNDILNWSLK